MWHAVCCALRRGVVAGAKRGGAAILCIPGRASAVPCRTRHPQPSPAVPSRPQPPLALAPALNGAGSRREGKGKDLSASPPRIERRAAPSERRESAHPAFFHPVPAQVLSLLP